MLLRSNTLIATMSYYNFIYIKIVSFEMPKIKARCRNNWRDGSTASLQHVEIIQFWQVAVMVETMLLFRVLLGRMNRQSQGHDCL